MTKARRNSARRARGGHSDHDRPLSLFGSAPLETDPITGYPAEVRTIQPFAAVKAYRCPGCNQEIRVGVGHVAVVPLAEPSARRHWHRGCWQHRSRRPGR